LWEAGAFVGGVGTPAYPASSDRTGRVLALPYVVYRGDVLRVDRSNVGARLVHTDDFEVDLGFAASLPASSQDVAVRNGMSDLGTLFEFGPRARGTVTRLSPGSRIRYDLPLRAVIEMNNGIRTQGFAMEPELTYEVRDVYDGWRLSTGVSVVVGDSRLQSYFYGVPAYAATPQRPAFEAQAGLLATRLSLSTAKSITPDVRVFAFVRYENYDGAANRASPLFVQSSGTAAGIGLTWTFARSGERARD
jgi:outer membrane scaffolding protein for murein synthesis (MipA/OmpV family)